MHIFKYLINDLQSFFSNNKRVGTYNSSRSLQLLDHYNDTTVTQCSLTSLLHNSTPQVFTILFNASVLNLHGSNELVGFKATSIMAFTHKNTHHHHNSHHPKHTLSLL